MVYLHITYLLIAIAITFLSGVFGKHLKPFGYESLSAFDIEYSSPAFNVLYRVVFPIFAVFILINVCAYLGWKEYAKDIWLVTLYYFVVRICYIIIKGRCRLANWKSICLTSLTSTALTYFLYSTMMAGDGYMPNRQSIVDQVWILLALFIYKIFNEPSPNEIKNYEEVKIVKIKKYVNSVYSDLKKRYMPLVLEQIKESDKTKKTEIINCIFAIMIYENFNRPAIFRFFERIAPRKFVKTTGIMQYSSDKKLSNEESIKWACKRIIASYKNDHDIHQVAHSYNHSDEYATNICRIYAILDKKIER